MILIYILSNLLLCCLQVSVFLKSKVQQTNGRFLLPPGGPVPFGFEIPGVIRLDLTDLHSMLYTVLLSNRYFNEEGDVVNEQEFPSEVFYHLAEKAGSWDVEGDRVTTLGNNM